MPAGLNEVYGNALKFDVPAGTDRIRLKNYDRDNGQAGVYAPTAAPVGHSTLALTANQARFARFTVSRPMTITSISFAVSVAAGADDEVDVGIYNGVLTRLGSAGATAGKLNGLGAKNVALTASVPLVPGEVYYAALSSGTQGGTAATIISVSFSTTGASALFGTSAPAVEAGLQASAHPLPASLDNPPSASTAGAFLALKE